MRSPSLRHLALPLLAMLAGCATSTHTVQLRDARATEIWAETAKGPVLLLPEGSPDDAPRAGESPVTFAIRHSKTMSYEGDAVVPDTSPPFEDAASVARGLRVVRYWDGEVLLGWTGRAVVPVGGRLGIEGLGAVSGWAGDDRYVGIHVRVRALGRWGPMIGLVVRTARSNVAWTRSGGPD